VILCSIALDDQPAADAGLQKLLADYADSRHMAEIVRNIAAEYQRQGKPGPALTLHQYVVDKHPASLEALWCQRDIALSHIEAADEQATEAALQKLVTGFAGNARLPEAIADIAEQYRRKGRFQNARILHEQVVTQFPSSAEAIWSQRNLILANVGLNDDSAIQADLQTLLTQFAQDNDIAAVVCYVADRLGHPRDNERLQLYQYIIDQHPQHDLAIRARAKTGQIQIVRGDTAAGESLFGTLVTQYASQPVVSQIVHLMADAYYEKAFWQERQVRQELTDGQPRTQQLSAEARTFLQRAIEKWDLTIEQLPLHPQVTPMSCYYAASAYYQLGDYPKALQYCARMLERWPDHEQAWRTRMLMAKLYKRQMGDGTLPEPQALAAMTESFRQMLQKYPASATAPAARSWLLRYDTSSEGGER
jgi:tetratricopeptide (TPR) repeat protein